MNCKLCNCIIEADWIKGEDWEEVEAIIDGFHFDGPVCNACAFDYEVSKHVVIDLHDFYEVSARDFARFR